MLVQRHYQKTDLGIVPDIRFAQSLGELAPNHLRGRTSLQRRDERQMGQAFLVYRGEDAHLHRNRKALDVLFNELGVRFSLPVHLASIPGVPRAQ